MNGQTVPDQELERELLRLSSGLEMDAPHAGGIKPDHLRSAATRNVLWRTLLLQAAAARKLVVTPAEIEAERRQRWGTSRGTTCSSGVVAAIGEDMLLERTRAYLARHVPRPSRAEAEHFYRSNPNLYHLPEAVHAAHIQRNAASPDELLIATAALEKADAELRRGRAFDRIADQYSECKGAGGSVGWVVRGQMVQEFEDVVFKLKPGARSGIFRTVFGLHIATIRQYRKAGAQPFEQVRTQIANQLFAAARQRHLTGVLSRMEAESDILFSEEPRHA